MIAAAGIACKSLREFLLFALPAKVTAVNLTRKATLTTPAAGPWTIPALGSISPTLDNATWTACALTAGSRTAAQLAAEINTAMGATVATALDDGRLRFTSTTAPAGPDTASVIGLAADTTGAQLVLGFDPGGELVVRAPLVTPTNKGVMDGEPNGAEDPFAAGRMTIVIRDREDAEVQFRRDERIATMELLVYTPQIRQNYHADREEIQAACEAVLDVLATTSGRQFGRSAENDVGFTTVKSLKVSGSSWGIKSDGNLLCDIARLVVTARVFQRASLT